MREKSMAAEFKGTVLEVLGTAVSIGCNVNGESPKKATAAIKAGDLDVSA